jgi:hypothetical protein
LAVARGAEEQTLEQRKAAARAALIEIERQEAEEAAAARAAAAVEAAAARRARMTNHEAALLDAHQAKLQALQTAEQHFMVAVEAINAAMQAEKSEREAARLLALAMNVKTNELNLAETETIRRLVGGICAHLARISVCHMRRLGALVLLDDPRTRDAQTWAGREANATGPSVATLLRHAENADAA